MCGGGVPEDNSVELARIDAQQARKEQARLAAEEKKNTQLFNRNLGGAFDSSLNQAKRYFNQQGLDPSAYLGDIRGAAQGVRGAVPFLDSNPGSYFSGLGEDVFNDLTLGNQNKQTNTLQSLLPQNFASTRITNDVDDATIEAILGEQRNTADDYLQNLLARGVITNSGLSGAQKNLDRQTGTARSSLDEIGRGLIEGGRGDIDTIITNALRDASQVKLGQQFDPYSYKQNANDSLESFFSGLGGKFRAKAPTDLFDTSGLAGVAGAAQGAQNTKFDTNALAGIFGSQGDEEDDTQKKASGNGGASNPFG